MASSKSLAVAGSMVKTRFACKSRRLATSAWKLACASTTIASTSSKRSSSKSTSWSSSSCSMSACFSSASKSPAWPKHWPFNRPSGNDEDSVQRVMSTGQSWNLSNLPGSLRIFLRTSLTCNKIQGMRLSVGFALMRRSFSVIIQSGRAFPSLSFGCKVQIMTRLEPLRSAMATIFPRLSLTSSRLLPAALASLGPSVTSSSASSPAMSAPLNTTSSSDSSSESSASSSSTCASSPGGPELRRPVSSSSSSMVATMTTSPCTARFLGFFPLMMKSLTMKFSLSFLEASGLTHAVPSFDRLHRSTPRTSFPECKPRLISSSSK
mmetsp:Transcript_125357/g.267603  ORF Transcript_125357/g.267603 Transcript_125357/m.267603 type:complete len:322 (-) Transcript_125357:332-1297(-)